MVSHSMEDWSGRPPPAMPLTKGQYVEIAPAVFPDHREAVFACVGGAENDDLWRFIPFGPFDDAAALGAGMAAVVNSQGWQPHIIRHGSTGDALGIASLMRIRPMHGSSEVGCILFSRSLQKTPAATEAMYLMARYIFEDLNYRRYEWKCDNNNAASKAAAERLGFKFEGIFRNDMVVKGKNRDTAWYSMTDDEWPRLASAMSAWLSPDNFDEDGMQRRSLAHIRAVAGD